MLLPRKLVLDSSALSLEDIEAFADLERKHIDGLPDTRIEKLAVYVDEKGRGGDHIDTDKAKAVLTHFVGHADFVNFKNGWWDARNLEVFRPFCGLYSGFGISFRTRHEDSQLPLDIIRSAPSNCHAKSPAGRVTNLKIRNQAHPDDWFRYEHKLGEKVLFRRLRGALAWRKRVAYALLDVFGYECDVSKVAVKGIEWPRPPGPRRMLFASRADAMRKRPTCHEIQQALALQRFNVRMEDLIAFRRVMEDILEKQYRQEIKGYWQRGEEPEVVDVVAEVEAVPEEIVESPVIEESVAEGAPRRNPSRAARDKAKKV